MTRFPAMQRRHAADHEKGRCDDPGDREDVELLLPWLGREQRGSEVYADRPQDGVHVGDGQHEEGGRLEERERIAPLASSGST